MAVPVPLFQDGGYGSAKAGPTRHVIRTTVRTARNAAPQSGIPLTNLCCMNLLFIIGVHTFILPSAMLCPSALEDTSFPWTWSMPLPHEQAPPASPSSFPRGIPPESPLAGPTPPQDERFLFRAIVTILLPVAYARRCVALFALFGITPVAEHRITVKKQPPCARRVSP
jgi:hypothetical protein